MESFRAALKQFASHVSKAACIYGTAIGLFSYHVLLNKDMACTCKEQLGACWLYMTSPACLLFVLILWIDKPFQRSIKYKLYNCDRKFIRVLSIRILKAAMVSTLWCIAVLIDGDWFVCCYNDHTEQQAQLACKDKTAKTAEDQALIAELKNKSREIGLPLLCITLVASCMSAVPLDLCTANADKLKDIILEECENLATKKLRENANVKLTEKLNACFTGNDWVKCFDFDEITKEIISAPNNTPADASTPEPAEPSSPGQSTESTPSIPMKQINQADS
ncbi:uncharacterized protein LOC120558739 [Perca fluviatilis]|nr:uncharacterized protein LOC120558739 [Perca fluviatilis]